MGESSAGSTTASVFCTTRSPATRSAARAHTARARRVGARRGDTRAAMQWLALAALVALVATVAGCAFMRDPMDPRGKLDHRVVKDFADAEHLTRGRHAFERARPRIDRVRSGMTTADVEIAMEAIVVTETKGAKDDEGPRRKFVDGYLCSTDPSPLRRRWLFGYDEGGVELVGFAIEFERDNPEKENWIVRGVDTEPHDDCPETAE